MGLTKLIEIEPNNPEYYNNLGFAYFNNEEYQKAIDAYTKAIELNPNEGLYYSDRANAYGKLGKQEELKADLQRSRRANSDFVSRRFLKLLQLTP
ncbi:MAG: tetratricopeptide repeat protein [Crocosphaera sp.]|uniref:tetratricopeptide repeat protein n=1 Tax=Crocosphaera sp. TaxID=2729996 RepID=UPI002586202B|nr:tetratricopeptide repeat protein [Crocosphaera sp.]MCH2232486.1 tetratricopeptide repeat protein [Crocinitomicaceae bacterium]MCH2248017.1 tetratricopeptide repeat protein [Crocosphaera sp.]